MVVDLPTLRLAYRRKFNWRRVSIGIAQTTLSMLTLFTA